MRAQGKEIELADWPVAILAGGLSTRLRPATDKTPKALLSVAGEPFLIHQLRLLHSQSLRRIVLCLGYLGEMIKAELGDGKQSRYTNWLFVRWPNSPRDWRRAEARASEAR
jgi:NDP-sugar pyrophosphorylase family protein